MSTVTVHAGESGVMQEVVFGSPKSPAEQPDTKERGRRRPIPYDRYDYLLMALGA